MPSAPIIFMHRRLAGPGRVRRPHTLSTGFYIFRGNEDPTDHKRRKLVLKDGDEEDGGDFVFCKEPRFSRQVPFQSQRRRPPHFLSMAMRTRPPLR